MKAARAQSDPDLKPWCRCADAPMMAAMTRTTAVDPDPVKLSDRCFAGAGYDFSILVGHPKALVSRSHRRGVAVVVLRTQDLPSGALESILAWRLGQYLLTGFYDPAVVQAKGLTAEPLELVHDRDVHGFAIDDDGDLLCYLTLKQPALTGDQQQHPYADSDRPLFPCEEIHGRGWQKGLTGASDVRTGTVWELARFVKDQRRPDEPVCLRAPLELGLVAARLARHPQFQPRVRLVTGDLDPEVALKSLRYFFLPVATFAPHHVELPDGDALAPRYRDNATAPFLAAPADVDNTTYIRWADIDLALDCGDDEAAVRLLALRQFVRVKESSLKRPLAPPEGSVYPVDALVAPSSFDVSVALWEAARGGEIPWTAVELGPGEPLSKEDAFWIVDGFVQALVPSPGGGTSHLSGLGPEVAFLPYEGWAEGLAGLEAVTPLRALITSQDHFEDFWRQRQSIFETGTETLYD